MYSKPRRISGSIFAFYEHRRLMTSQLMGAMSRGLLHQRQTDGWHQVPRRADNDRLRDEADRNWSQNPILLAVTS